MRINAFDFIDFEKVNTLLEGFNQSTGFVTAILDLDGNVLSKSGWRQVCTEFHRINPETLKKCTISYTELANNMGEGEKYHFYKCLNGLVDVAVPLIINGEHVANLFSGQFFFEEPDNNYFKKQAEKYGFNVETYLKCLAEVPVVSKEKVIVAMDFLANMTQMISEITFQKLEQMEGDENIRKSEEKFKAIFESANVGKSITTLTGEVSVNKAFCDMLGYTSEELQNKKWQDLTPEDEIPIIQEFLDPLLKGEKESARLEKRYICKNNSLLWADVNFSIRRDEKGKPFHLITTVTDIAEKRLANEKLQQNEEQYRTLFENMNSGFALFEVVFNEQKIPVDLIIKAVNEEFEKTTGLNLKSAINQYLTVVIPGIEKDEDNWIGTYSKVAISGESVKFEQSSKHLGVHYLISAFQAAPNQCAVLFDDITERKKVEQELTKAKERAEESERLKIEILEKYLSTQKVANIGNWDWNMVTNEIWWSTGTYDIFEVSREEFIPDLINNTIFLLPDEIEIYNQVLKNCIENGFWLNHDFTVKTATGKIKFCNNQGKVEYNEKNEPIRFIGTLLDITSRKQAENALLAKMNELERFYKLMVDREITMVALKNEVNNLLNKLGQDNKYKIVK